MLKNNRVSVSGESVVGETKIATFSAIVTKGSDEVSLTMRIMDDDLYEANRAAVDSDRAEFEAVAFLLQDTLKA